MIPRCSVEPINAQWLFLKIEKKLYEIEIRPTLMFLLV